MSWTNIWTYYGLRKPFDFRTALPFLVAIIELLLVCAVFAYMIAKGSLNLGTERFYFFGYIAVLLVVAASSARITFFSFVIIIWCTIELCLALSSSVLETFGIGRTLLPRNIVTPPPSASAVLRPRFHYHPFLQVVPAPSWHGTVRLFDSRNVKEWRRFIGLNFTNATDHDFVFNHNSLGLRGPELANSDLKKDLIFVYGGSTTYDWTVTQGLTWVERLQSRLSDKHTLLNLGVPNHSTVEHLIYTAFYQDLLGKYPSCAVYYVGWNDLISAHVDRLDPTYSSYHALYEVVRKPEAWPARYSPVVRLGYRAISRRIDSVPPFSRPPVSEASGVDARLIRIFVNNVRTIIAINSQRGVKTVFIGQLLNRELLAELGDMPGAFFVVKGKYTWAMQEQLNSILSGVAVSAGAKYIDAGIENFIGADFADVGHFAAAGSNKFASLISDELEDYCARSAVTR